MATLLLEIGCEELPATACRDVERQLPELVERELGRTPDEVYVGPRRLAVIVRDLAERTPDQWIKGPPLTLRDRAAAGFAKKQGVAVDDLDERDGFLGVARPGRALADVLPEQLDAVVRGLSFRKTMRWDESGLRYPRPLRWLLARLDGATVAGFAGVSWGHRFTHGEVEVPDADAYLETLRGVDVEPDADERRRLIVEALDAIGGWSDRAGKLDEVVFLVEKPTVLRASFDERFLELPERVIVTTMQSHQRYFPLGGAGFAVVINGGDPDTARRGHEQVLEARLEDAAFTFGRDKAKGIQGLFEELPSITFIGETTYSEKAARMGAIALQLNQGSDDVFLAVRYAKADQAAELVREFPDLEGYIGSIYARLNGLSEEVALAIEDHYLPKGPDSPLPRTTMGRVVAAADKIDNLETNFRIGNRPTGSRDPFALRRAAIGLNRIAEEGGLAIPRDLLELSRDFVEERLEGLIEVPVEYVRAARASSVPELGAVARRARDLFAARDSDDFAGAYTVYDRAKSLAGKHTAGSELNETIMVPAEAAVAEQLKRVDVDQDFAAALASAALLAGPMERFFDEVLVMDPDERKRTNRLTLLRRIEEVVGQLGDFSQIPR